MTPEYVHLQEVAQIIMGQSPASTSYNTEGQGLPFFQGKTEFGERHPIPVKWCSEPKKIAEANDILISVRAPVGPTNIANEKCCIGRGLAAIRHDERKINSDYLLYYLQYAEKILVEKGQGSTFQAINTDDLRQLNVPLHDINVQRKISSKLKNQLAEVDKARKAAEIQVSEAKFLKARMLEHIFSELDATTKYKIGDRAITTSGSTPARGNKSYWEKAEIPWVKTAEVAFEPIVKTSESITKTALDECSVTLLPPKTVLVAMYGQGKTRGQSAVLEVAATTNQACFAILPNDTWDPEFLFLWLKRSYQNLRALSEDRGGNQANLNGALLKAFEVPTPSLSVQGCIVKKIKAALQEIKAIENSNMQTLSHLNQLPNRLLAQAFEF